MVHSASLQPFLDNKTPQPAPQTSTRHYPHTETTTHPYVGTRSFHPGPTHAHTHTHTLHRYTHPFHPYQPVTCVTAVASHVGGSCSLLHWSSRAQTRTTLKDLRSSPSALEGASHSTQLSRTGLARYRTGDTRTNNSRDCQCHVSLSCIASLFPRHAHHAQGGPII